MKNDFQMEQETKRFKVRPSWDRGEEEGDCFGWVRANGMRWAIVLFDGEEDVETYEASALLIKQVEWKAL